MQSWGRFAWVFLLVWNAQTALSNDVPPSPNACETALQIGTLSEGHPKLEDSALSPASYKATQAQRLAHAHVAWLNFDLLRELGIRIPKEGLTPEFEEQILDAFAYSIPKDTDPPGTFTEKFKEFFVDSYGGLGMGDNFGSGRAASAGSVQIKGFGRTMMVNDNDFIHSHGGASLEESIREAVYGEILNRELPIGANRVIAVIETGTNTYYKGLKIEPRALIIRQDPVRPAHFLSNEAASQDREWKAWNKARVKAALARVVESLPMPENADPNWDHARKLREGLLEFANRVGRQYGTAYVRNFYHGATSPGNIQINGRALDFGTQTAQPGYGQVLLLKEDAPNGDLSIIESDLLHEVTGDFKKRLPNEFRAAVPKDDEFDRVFESSFDRTAKHEFLKLTGAPDIWIGRVEATPASAKLAALLQSLAKEGNTKTTNYGVSMPKNMGTNEIRDALLQLALAFVQNPSKQPSVEDLADAIAQDIPNAASARELAQAYLSFRQEIKTQAAEQGVSQAGLNTLLYESARMRAKKMADLYRPDLLFKNYRMIIEHKLHPQAGDLQTYMDEIIRMSTNVYPDLPFYRVGLNETAEVQGGVRLRRVYDARENQYYEVLQVPENTGIEALSGGQATTAELLESQLSFSQFGGEISGRSISPVKNGPYYEFYLPKASPTEPIDLRLTTSSGKSFKAQISPKADRKQQGALQSIGDLLFGVFHGDGPQ